MKFLTLNELMNERKLLHYTASPGGGVGQYLADWICEGEAPYELLEFDPLRYGAWTSMDYAVAKTRQGIMIRYIYLDI